MNQCITFDIFNGNELRNFAGLAVSYRSELRNILAYIRFHTIPQSLCQKRKVAQMIYCEQDGIRTDAAQGARIATLPNKIGSVRKESFVRFVYPFLFDSDAFSSLTQSISEASWRNDTECRPIWKSSCFAEDDLLPHVARYLNEGGGDVSCVKDAGHSTAHLWSMQRDALDSVNWGLGAKAEWRIELSKNRTIRFRWVSIELTIFRLGTGFFTIEACPCSHDLASWIDFIYYFRFFGGNRATSLHARRRLGPNIWEDFYPPVIDKIEDTDKVCLHSICVLDYVLRSAVSGKYVTQRWWQDVFIPGQAIPYVCLLVEDAPTEPKHKAELLYLIRTIFHSNQMLHPSDDDIRLDHASVLSYAMDQWFFFSLDGGGYLAMNPPKEEFFVKTMPDHVRKQYFLLFLISANQRFSLMSLQQQVAEKWLTQNVAHRELTFERIYEHILEFEARVYFAQVMQREHHHRCYRKCQEVFQISQLHEELSGEVKRMYERINLERSERMQRRIDLLTFMIGLPALMFGFMSVPWENLDVSWTWRIAAFVGLMAFGGILVLCVRTSGTVNKNNSINKRIRYANEWSGAKDKEVHH